MGSTLPTQYGTHTVFTGTDIYTVFADMIISTLQGMSYSITRQKAPIYTMGSPDPRAFARSKRGIAGSMILTTFDRHALADFMKSSEFAAKQQSIETTTTNPYNSAVTTSIATVADSIQTTSPEDVSSSLLSSIDSSLAVGAGTEQMSELSAPMYSDQLMPFDSTLMGSNEAGIGAVMRVFGIEVLNEGAGVSIDDTSNEVQMTYIAKLLSPWVNQTRITPVTP